MMGFDRTDDYQPLTYIKGHPLYVTTLAIVLHASAFVAACLLYSVNQGRVLEALEFSSGRTLEHLQLWRLFSYAFVHNPGQGPWLAVELFLFFQFGQEVEKYLGRRVFLILYGALLLTPAVLLTVVGAITGQDLPMLAPLIGSQQVHFGIFVAFVTLYPNVQFFFGILAKWIVFAYLGVYTLIMLAARDKGDLMVLWSSVTMAYFGTRQAGGGGGAFSLLTEFRERFPIRTTPAGVKPRLRPRRASGENGGSDLYESIDPLLDKISQHGMSSLTRSERATLERARVSLLRKERGG